LADNGTYYYGTGRRKNAVARVRLYPGEGTIMVNNKPPLQYFGRRMLEMVVVEPLKLTASRVSLHVVEAANAADSLLDLARANHVDLIVLGAPRPDQHAFGWWRSVASGVTANASCSVHVVRIAERLDEDERS